MAMAFIEGNEAIARPAGEWGRGRLVPGHGHLKRGSRR